MATAPGTSTRNLPSEDEETAKFDLGDVVAEESGSKGLDADSNIAQPARLWNRCWLCCLAIGYSLVIPCLAAKGRMVLVQVQGGGGVEAGTPTASSLNPYPGKSSEVRHWVNLQESPGLTNLQGDYYYYYSEDPPIMATNAYTRQGMAWVDELLSVCKTQRSIKPALTRVHDWLAKNERARLEGHKILHRFGHLYTVHMAEEGALSVLGEFIDFDDLGKEEARAIMAGQKPLTAGQHVTQGPKYVRDGDLLNVCNAAVMHGVIETFFAAAGHAGLIEAAADWTVQRLWPLVANDTRFAFATLHSLGHAFWHNRWDAHQPDIIDDALHLADDMASDDVYAGVWLGHFYGTATSSSYPDNAATSISVCYADVVNKRGIPDCVRSAPIAFLLLRPREYVAALQWCEKACYELFSGPEASQCEHYCIGGVAMQAVKENLDDIAVVGRICEQVRELEHITPCVQHAKGSYMMATGTPISDAECSLIESPRVANACREVQ